jgi:exosortase A
VNFMQRTASLNQSVGAAPSAQSANRVGDSTLAPGWVPAAILIALAAVVFGFAFSHDILDAASVWIASTAYNHCFLVLPLIGYLLWERRSLFFAVSPLPSFWPLLAMPLLSAIWLVSAVLDLNEGRQLVVVATFEIVLLATLGVRAFRLLLAPALFLFFLVPSGAFLVPILQKITVNITVYGLHLVNIPVYSDGMMIEIPEGRFEIAEACAGLRFLIASIVFGCFFSVTMYDSFIRRALFIALSATVPVGANGLRALGIITLAHLDSSAAAVEADHILYGWIFFSLVILLLIAIGMVFVDKGNRPPAIPEVSESAGSPGRLAVVAALAVVLALAGPACAARLNSQAPAITLPPKESMKIMPPWRVVHQAAVDWRPLVHGADRELLQTFEEPGSPPVVSFIALYRLRAIGNALTNSENRMADEKIWQVASSASVEVPIAGQPETISIVQMVSGSRRRLVWSFYVVDGEITTGLFEAKLLQARAVLLRRSPIAAFVAASVSSTESGDQVVGQLRRFFEASQPTQQLLTALSEGRSGSADIIRPYTKPH